MPGCVYVMSLFGKIIVNSSVAFVVLIVVSVLSGWMGYRFGKQACPACVEVTSQPRFRKEHIKPILELALVYRNNQEQTDIEVPPGSEFAQWLARQFAKIGVNKTAKYTFLYDVNYRFGVDLDRNPWSIRVSSNNKVELILPEVELVGCPAIDTGSIAIDIRQTSIFVMGEKEKIPALLKRLTEESVKTAETYLEHNRNVVTALVQEKATKLIRAISQAYGMDISTDAILITHQPISDRALSLSEKLNYYGCSIE